MDKRTRYSPEVRDRTIRLVREHGPEHDSQWTAIRSVEAIPPDIRVAGELGESYLSLNEGFSVTTAHWHELNQWAWYLRSGDPSTYLPSH